MAYILGNVPYFRVLVRKEYLRDLADGHGIYVPGVAHAVRCVRGDSLWFQTQLLGEYGGCAFLLPIEALCWKTCEAPADKTYIQPWDVFSSTFSVVELDFVRRGLVYALPERIKGEYHFTIDFTGTDLADDPVQHKCLHVCFLESGLIGAFPNNRILWSDSAWWKVRDDKPDLEALDQEFRSEGPAYQCREWETLPATPATNSHKEPSHGRKAQAQTAPQAPAGVLTQ